MAKKTETKKTTSKKVTGKTVTDDLETKATLNEGEKVLNMADAKALETETASDQESPEALAYRRGDVIKIEREGVVIDATYKAYTSVYQPKGYKIVSQKQK